MSRGLSAVALLGFAGLACEQTVNVGVPLCLAACGDGGTNDGGMTDGGIGDGGMIPGSPDDAAKYVVAPQRGGSARPQLVLDAAGQEHILYADATDPVLWYATRATDGSLVRMRLSRFAAGTTVTPVGSPAFDSAGNLHALYTAGTVFYRERTSAGWAADEPVPDVDAAAELRFAVTPDGDSFVAEWKPGSLRVHRRTTGVWTVDELDSWSAVPSSGTPGLVVSSTGQPVVLARHFDADPVRVYALSGPGRTTSRRQARCSATA